MCPRQAQWENWEGEGLRFGGSLSAGDATYPTHPSFEGAVDGHGRALGTAAWTQGRFYWLMW